MDNNKTGKNNIFEGKILPTTMKLAMPIAASNFLMFLYFIADTIFISRIDTTSTAILSGVGLIFPIYMIFLALRNGITFGVGTFVARGIGEKNSSAINKAADSGFVLSLILSLLLVCGGYFFGRDMISLLAGSKLSGEAVEHGINYLYYYLPGMGILLLESVLFGVLQGEGLMKYAAWGYAITFILNIILDPILIFTFNMGVAGASLATTISIAISALYLISVIFRNKSSVKINWNILNAQKKIVYEITRIGLSNAVGFLCISVTIIFLNKIVSSIGEAEMNAWIICLRADNLLLLPSQTISAVTMTMIGQNYGKKNLKRVWDIYRRHILYCVVAIFFLAVIYITLIAPFLISILTNVQAVIDGAMLQVKVLSFMYLTSAFVFVSLSAFLATGRPIPPILINVARTALFIVPPAFLLVYVFNMGMIGVFASLGFGNLLLMILCWFWTNHHLKNLEYKELV
ncbi:MAG: MATE family efflux transporter [bacterium]|nr:MATE family efflux transporter [bacterium]